MVKPLSAPWESLVHPFESPYQISNFANDESKSKKRVDKGEESEPPSSQKDSYQKAVPIQDYYSLLSGKK